MKKILYHGTKKAIARKLQQGQVVVSLGGGEFGQGFYMGTSRRLAKRRGYHKENENWGSAADALCAKRYAGNTFWVEVQDDRLGYHYNCLLLDQQQAIDLYNDISNDKVEASYTRGVDVIRGAIVGKTKPNHHPPLRRFLNVEQYKFENSRTETLLNYPDALKGIVKKGVE